MDGTPVSVNGNSKFWLGAGSELSCQIDTGNPVCDLTVPGMCDLLKNNFLIIFFKYFLDKCAILYDETNQSGASEVIPIGEFGTNSCPWMVLIDMAESVRVFSVKRFKLVSFNFQVNSLWSILYTLCYNLQATDYEL